jgi:hypothetical protein
MGIAWRRHSVRGFTVIDFQSGIPAQQAQPKSTATDIVADLDRAMQWAVIFEVDYPRRIRTRIARLRQFLAEIEQAAAAGVGLDWADCITLPPLERAMEQELELRARLAGWVRERGAR